MTPDDAATIDEQLLESLLAADAAAGRRSRSRRRPVDREERSSPLTKTSPNMSTSCAGWVIAQRPRRCRNRTATPPLRLGRFEIVDTLGQGGFGIVYLARDPMLGREVALKVPRPEVLITPDVRRRFLREARAAAGLDHPNIVAVHEVGEAGPVCYIASAYCAGPTLSAWLKARTEPVPPRLAAQLVACVERRRPARPRSRRPPPRHQAEQRDPVGAPYFWFRNRERARRGYARSASMAKPTASANHRDRRTGERLDPSPDRLRAGADRGGERRRDADRGSAGLAALHGTGAGRGPQP